MSEDLPTLGTPITRMLCSELWKPGRHRQGAAGYHPSTPAATGSCHREIAQYFLALLAHLGVPWLEREVTLPLLCIGAASPHALGAVLGHHDKKEMQDCQSVQRRDTRIGKDLEGHTGVG